MNPIHAERKLRGWSRPAMARKLRDAADDPRDVTSIESLVHNIHRWEGGGSGVSERYRLLYCRVFARTEFELFGIEPPSIITELPGKSTPPAAGIPAGTVTSEDPSGNRYVVLVLPPGPQRIVIDVTSTDAGGEPGAVSQPARLLTVVQDPTNEDEDPVRVRCPVRRAIDAEPPLRCHAPHHGRA